MEFQDVIQGRYSVRKYKPEMPSKEEIMAVLEAGNFAPTAKNVQSQRLFVLTKEEDLAKIDELTPFRFGAPVVIICTYDKNEALDHGMFYEGESWSYGTADLYSCLVHMILKATDLGLGTCWVGAPREADVQAAFNLPENLAVKAFLPLGYPTPECKPGPLHDQYKDLEEIVSWL